MRAAPMPASGNHRRCLPSCFPATPPLPDELHLPRAGAWNKTADNMTTNRRTLLAQLAPLFGPQTENLAVEALGHILSGSEAARSALSELLQAGGAGIGQVAQVRTQDAGDDGARPDLVGTDEDGEERVLIEAKFWAGLTSNQPRGYLERLASAPQPSALLFVAPAQRLDSLWPELCRLAESASDVALDSDAEGLQSAKSIGGPYLMLTSWRTLLGRMAGKVSAAADLHTEIDIRQLHGLAEQQDKEAFLPLRQEELGPQLPRRVIDLTGIVDDAVGRVRKTEWVSTRRANRRRNLVATATTYGIWLTFPRAEEIFGKLRTYFGVSYGHWARHRDTPLWVWFWDAPAELRRMLDPLRDKNPPQIIGTGNRLSVPIELPVGRERGEVLDAVVARLLEIARLITPE